MGLPDPRDIFHSNISCDTLIHIKASILFKNVQPVEFAIFLLTIKALFFKNQNNLGGDDENIDVNLN